MTERLSGVYKIVNLHDGKMTTYVGSSQDVNQRWKEHRQLLNRVVHPNRHLQYAWLKYSSKAFEFSVIKTVPVEKLLVCEQEQLDQCRTASVPLYNLAVSALGPMRGRHHTSKTRAQMSASHKGLKHTEATKKKIGEAHVGKVVSAETRAKVGQANSRAYPAFVHVDSGERIPAGYNLKALCRRLGFDQSAMWRVIQGKNSHHHRWMLADGDREKVLALINNRRHTDETKAKISKAKGKPYPALRNIITGERITAGINLTLLCDRIGLSRSYMSTMIAGRALHCQGWVVATTKADPPMGPGKPYPAFIHRASQQVIVSGFNLTRTCRDWGLVAHEMWEVVHGRRLSHKGWYLLDGGEEECA